MRVRAPIVVRPATTTCESSTAPSCEDYLRSHMAERADLDAGAELSAGFDDGGRVDGGGAGFFRSLRQPITP